MSDKVKQPKKLPDYLSEENIKKLLDAPYKTNQHHIIMMKFAYKVGLRNSEICYLRKRHILFEESKVKVEEGKGAKDRIVPIPFDFLMEIKEYIEKHELKHDDRLFDIKERGLRAMMKRYGERAGIEQNIHPHLLRHTFAVHSLKAGANLRSVQKALGHKHLSTTEIYLGITDEDVAEDFRRHPLPV